MILPPAEYAANVARYTGLRDARARTSARISRLRLATVLPALAVLVWLLSQGFTAGLTAVMVLLFLAFGGLVVWHARVEERLAWYEALRVVNERAIARGRRDWNSLPAADVPLPLETASHPYALDLDVFGRASLYQWLGPAATARGAIELAAWLLTPADRSEIDARQQAAAELASAAEWREEFSAQGILTAAAGAPRLDTFLQWAEGRHPLGSSAPVIHAVAVTIPVALWILMALQATGVTATAVWFIPLTIGVVLSYALARPITGAFERAGAGQQALRAYAGLFDLAARAPSSASRLSGIQQRLSAGGLSAAGCMRHLNRILAFADLRRGAAIFHFVIQALTLWDFHVFFALERWRRKAGGRVRAWLDALSALDALALVAAVRYDNSAWCAPEIGGAPQIEALALGHPLIPDDRRVHNDVSVGPPGTVLLVTGSNMSGKSTLLRAIGLNAILAQSGAAVCARRFSMPQIDLQTSIRVQDSLELGLSYFMAALARLKGVVDAAEHEREGRVLLYLLDEILQGTNSAERSIAVRAIARHLIEAGAIGAMTSHDLSLATEEPLKTAARLVHFTETVDENGVMRFDYTLRPGLAPSRNALRLMQMIGIDL